MRTKKTIILSVFTAVLLLVSLAGCASTTASSSTINAGTSTTTKAVSPYSQSELKQIVADCETATQAANTYRMNIDMSSNTNIDNGKQKGGMKMKANAFLDEKTNQMFMSVNMTTIPGNQEQSVEMYIFTDYIYAKVTVPGVGEQWIKTTANDQIKEKFNIETIDELTALLDNFSSVEWVKDDTTRGVACYVLKITPGQEYLKKYAQEQAGTQAVIDWSKVPDASSIYQNLDIELWIAKDTKYLYRMDTKSTIVFDSDFTKIEGVDYTTAVTDVEALMETYDFGAAFDVQLPAEAQNAFEVSPDVLLGK